MTWTATNRTSPNGLVRLGRGCWIEASAVGDLAARCTAVLETSADDTVICGTTAARLHGMWLPAVPDVIHVATATPGRAGKAMTRTKRPEFVAHRLQLRMDDVTAVGAVPITTLARTWRDLAGELGFSALVAAGDSALRMGASADDLNAVLGHTQRARYARRARTALAQLDPRSRSRPESHLRVAVSAPDLPRFAVNEAVSRSSEGWLAEPDLSLAEAKIALEYQGRDHAELRRMRRDLTRSSDMRREGWLVNLYGPAETFERPWEITAEVRAAIRERAPHLLRPAARRRVTEWPLTGPVATYKRPLAP